MLKFNGTPELVQQKTERESAQELELVTTALSVLEQGFAYANSYPAETHDQLLARKGLVSQNYSNLKASLLLATQGYYLQSLGIIKNLYENWLAFWYLAKFPLEATRWLDTSSTNRPPTAETMRNKIDHAERETKDKLKDLYSEMNRFAHTDPVAVIDRIRFKASSTGVFVGVEFDKRNFSACTYWLLIWSGNMLDAISVWIPNQHKWHQQHQEVQQRVSTHLDMYNELTSEK